MNLKQLANPRILDQPVYTPGKPIEKVAEQFGFAHHEIVKLASNENPWGASPNAVEAGKRALELMTRRKICMGVHGIGHGRFVQRPGVARGERRVLSSISSQVAET